jgi:putative membrane protein
LKKSLLFLAVPFLVLNGFFVARMNDYPELRRFADHPALATISAVFVLFFALPSFWSLVKWLGARRGVLALLALGCFAVGIETCAVLTGYPYGQFSYGDKIGFKLFGVTPWTVPFAWTPLMLAGYALACRAVARSSVARSTVEGFAVARRQTRSTAATIIVAALFTVVVDTTLDPGAVAQKFWTYRYPGVYYGVPWSNFAGWMFSGVVGAAILQSLVRRDETPPAGLLLSTWLILVFWSSVCAWSALWIPALIGIMTLGFISRDFFHARSQANA